MSDTGTHHFIIYPDSYQIMTFPRDTEFERPSVQLEQFISITYAPESVAMICPESALTHKVSKASTGWRVVQIKGPYSQEQGRYIAEVVRVVKEHGVSTYVSGNYETDYFLLQSGQLAVAVEAMKAIGHRVDVQS